MTRVVCRDDWNDDAVRDRVLAVALASSSDKSELRAVDVVAVEGVVVVFVASVCPLEGTIPSKDLRLRVGECPYGR